jgi:hypothetical protein
MNIYIVVEGELGARRIYENWISYLNPNLLPVADIFKIAKNNYAVLASMGYPFYFQVIQDAIDDINGINNIDRLVLVVDSEEMTFDGKMDEMLNFLKGKICNAEIKIIIQHFCFETWALGNKRLGPRNPKNETLRKYKTFFNVLNDDPELLPSYPPGSLNRSQFAVKYLRKMLNDKNRNLTYTKSNTKALIHKNYLVEVKKRYENTGHIASFSTFLDAFS